MCYIRWCSSPIVLAPQGPDLVGKCTWRTPSLMIFMTTQRPRDQSRDWTDFHAGPPLNLDQISNHHALSMCMFSWRPATLMRVALSTNYHPLKVRLAIHLNQIQSGRRHVNTLFHVLFYGKITRKIDCHSYTLFTIYLCDLHNEREMLKLQQADYLHWLLSFIYCIHLVVSPELVTHNLSLTVSWNGHGLPIVPGTLGWEGQWDWAGRVGHGRPEDVTWSPQDFGMSWQEPNESMVKAMNTEMVAGAIVLY